MGVVVSGCGVWVHLIQNLAYSTQRVLGFLTLALCMSRVLSWTGTRAISSIFHPSRPSASLLANNLAAATATPAATSLVLKCSLSKESSADRMDFRVATYNILCSHLAEPSRFPLCSPKDLDAPTRLKRVKHKLDPEVRTDEPTRIISQGITASGL